MDVTTFVLAGGRSTRMGEEKAFLRLGDRLLIDHTMQTVRPLDGNVVIVGQTEKFAAFGPTVQDVYPDCGPLGGIHAALSSSKTPLNLIIPVDMPFLRSEYLLRLVEEARAATEAVVTVTKTDDGWQPLCSIYRLAFKQRAEAAIKSGQYRIDKLFGEDTRYVDACQLGYDARMFDNLNTPADFQRAVSFISEQVQP